MRLVIVESPYAGDVEANVAYARACLRDALPAARRRSPATCSTPSPACCATRCRRSASRAWTPVGPGTGRPTRAWSTPTAASRRGWRPASPSPALQASRLSSAHSTPPAGRRPEPGRRVCLSLRGAPPLRRGDEAIQVDRVKFESGSPSSFAPFDRLRASDDRRPPGGPSAVARPELWRTGAMTRQSGPRSGRPQRSLGPGCRSARLRQWWRVSATTTKRATTSTCAATDSDPQTMPIHACTGRGSPGSVSFASGPTRPARWRPRRRRSRAPEKC